MSFLQRDLFLLWNFPPFSSFVFVLSSFVKMSVWRRGKEKLVVVCLFAQIDKNPNKTKQPDTAFKDIRKTQQQRTKERQGLKEKKKRGSPHLSVIICKDITVSSFPPKKWETIWIFSFQLRNGERKNKFFLWSWNRKNTHMVHDRRGKIEKSWLCFPAVETKKNQVEEFLHHQPHGTEELFLRPRTTDYRYGSPCVSCRPYFLTSIYLPWPKREQDYSGKGDSTEAAGAVQLKE